MGLQLHQYPVRHTQTIARKTEQIMRVEPKIWDMCVSCFWTKLNRAVLAIFENISWNPCSLVILCLWKYYWQTSGEWFCKAVLPLVGSYKGSFRDSFQKGSKRPLRCDDGLWGIKIFHKIIRQQKKIYKKSNWFGKRCHVLWFFHRDTCDKLTIFFYFLIK